MRRRDYALVCAQKQQKSNTQIYTVMEENLCIYKPGTHKASLIILSTARIVVHTNVSFTIKKMFSELKLLYVLATSVLGNLPV